MKEQSRVRSLEHTNVNMYQYHLINKNAELILQADKRNCPNIFFLNLGSKKVRILLILYNLGTSCQI